MTERRRCAGKKEDERVAEKVLIRRERWETPGTIL